MKETFTCIDRALTAQRVDATPPLDKNVDNTLLPNYFTVDDA